mmetsp:Transcript_54069/g.175749  ORF Transcript_54069/g.175749 Transcript_54069/m.175749 type:complete len:229 (+) Transcript_54069:816-1502(+)
MLALESSELLLRDSKTFRYTLQLHAVGLNPFLELLGERGILLLQPLTLGLQCRPSGPLQSLLLSKATIRHLLRNSEGCLLFLQTFDLGLELCPNGIESCFLLLEAIDLGTKSYLSRHAPALFHCNLLPVESLLFVCVDDVVDQRIALCLQGASEGCPLFLEAINLSAKSCPSIPVTALFPCNLLPVASFLLGQVVDQRVALCLQGAYRVLHTRDLWSTIQVRLHQLLQ